MGLCPSSQNWAKWWKKFIPKMCSLYSFNDALTNKAISFYPPPSFFFLIYFLTERKLLYNVVLVSAIWQHESAIIIHIFPSLRNFPPIPHPTPLGHHRVRLSSLCYMATSHQLFILHMTVYICQFYFLHSPHPLLPSLCPQGHSLHLQLHSFPANSFISTIFPDFVYMH